jgi:hypothetical protein
VGEERERERQKKDVRQVERERDNWGEPGERKRESEQ